MTVTKNPKTGKWDCAFWYKDWQGVRKHTTKRGGSLYNEIAHLKN